MSDNLTVSWAPGPVTRSSRELPWGRFHNVFLLVFSLSFVSLFWPPGRPKRSIVANLAPQITPKWSLEWSHSDNARPLRNIHRHCRIAYPRPLGELHFHCFFRVRQKDTKHRFQKLHLGNCAPKWTQKLPSWDPDLTRTGSPFLIFFALGPPGSPI